MTSVIRLSVAWLLFGTIAAVVTYGPALSENYCSWPDQPGQRFRGLNAPPEIQNSFTKFI